MGTGIFAIMKDLSKRFFTLPSRGANQLLAELETSIIKQFPQLRNMEQKDVQTAKSAFISKPSNKKSLELPICSLINQRWVFSQLSDRDITYKPKVSVVLPVFNAEPYLEQCLDSILAQTLWDFELICVDDGSSDNSLAILEHYSKSDPRVIVLHQDNSNAGVARNVGMEAASGEYLMFLDADDFFEPDLLLQLYESCIVCNADISICAADRLNNITKQFEQASWLLNTSILPDCRPFSRINCPDFLFQIVTPCPWTKMFKRSFIINRGIHFQSIKRSNDLFFVYSALALSDRINICNRILVHYRINVPTSLQAGNSSSPFDFYYALSALQLKLKEEDIYNELESSFACLALNTILHNIDTQIAPESAKLVFDAFLERYIYEFDIKGKPKEVFTPFRYEQYQNMLVVRNKSRE